VKPALCSWFASWLVQIVNAAAAICSIIGVQTLGDRDRRDTRNDQGISPESNVRTISLLVNALSNQQRESHVRYITALD
jgi:hypothetical protein